jgi:hypothetical protein
LFDESETNENIGLLVIAAACMVATSVDAAPKKKVIGCGYAYRYSSAKKDFAVSAHSTIRKQIDPVEPENRVKYLTQMQVGFGLYLDMYTTPENAKWYFPPTEGSRLRTFSENLAQAIDVADEYVWVYGEKCWFDSIEIIPLN